MSPHYSPSLIEKIAESLHIIPGLHKKEEPDATKAIGTGLTKYPTPDKWDNWTEYESKSWPYKKKKTYSIIPTSCFNCEAGCGLLAYVDKETRTVKKFEGNPYHPGSRGRNCAKGPATINQINDVERILYPLKRKGPRGSGEWERVSWDEVLNDISAKIRKALQEDKRDEVVYHVGRPGHEGYIERVLKAWGVDGYNSHTTICSGAARTGYALWHGYDRPSPDHANARFILLISAHLESGHYFNPHAQRIIEGMMKGAKMAVMDPRLSNTASMANYWMPTYPGSEAAVLLAMAKIIIDEGKYNKEFMMNWVNWQETLKKEKPGTPVTFENFIKFLSEYYKDYTPEFAAKEAGISAESIIEVARLIGDAGTRFATHVWRAAAIGNLGGWAVSRSLHFLSVLTGAVGTEGGTLPNAWSKFKPDVFDHPPAVKFWNKLHFPDEYPLSHYEMSHILPHLVKDGRGKMQVYFTRVFNPVWTYPDGFTWIEMLTNEEQVGLHVALTPTWNETAYYADYVLPMGHSSERHDVISYETHAALWMAYRQPVLREFDRKNGKKVEFTYESNPGEVWEEDEFWIELSWRIDPDEKLGIRKHFISPYRKGEKINIDEYYRYIFEKIPKLVEAAKKENLSALEYMKKYGCFEVEEKVYDTHMKEVPADGAQIADDGTATKDGKIIGIMVDGKVRAGWPTGSKKQEFYSQTMVDWKWPEYRMPVYIKSHIHRDTMDFAKGDFPLVPTFRLPNLIHSRSGNAKWLVEIAHNNPLWMHTSDAERLGFETGDLARVNTDIGYFISKVWVTEAIKPNVIVCSHHIGRWRRPEDAKANNWATNMVKITQEDKSAGGSIWRMRVIDGIRPYKSSDPDTSRIYWNDGGVHQNITHGTHPDPISGHHAWHQKVTVEKAYPGDRYGDVMVDTNKSQKVFHDWLAMTRPAPGPNNLRRPLILNRPLRPVDEQYYMK